MDVKFVDDYLLNLPEFVVEKVNKDCWICDHIGIFYF